MASYIANISHSFFLYLLVFHSYVSLPIKKKKNKTKTPTTPSPDKRPVRD